jgi:hypothetical protein
VCAVRDGILACIMHHQSHAFASHLLPDLNTQIVVLLQRDHNVKQLLNIVELLHVGENGGLDARQPFKQRITGARIGAEL